MLMEPARRPGAAFATAGAESGLAVSVTEDELALFIMTRVGGAGHRDHDQHRL